MLTIASPEEVALEARAQRRRIPFPKSLVLLPRTLPSFFIPPRAHWSSCLAQLPTFLDNPGCHYLLLRTRLLRSAPLPQPQQPRSATSITTFSSTKPGIVLPHTPFKHPVRPTRTLCVQLVHRSFSLLPEHHQQPSLCHASCRS